MKSWSCERALPTEREHRADQDAPPCRRKRPASLGAGGDPIVGGVAFERRPRHRGLAGDRGPPDLVRRAAGLVHFETPDVGVDIPGELRIEVVRHVIERPVFLDMILCLRVSYLLRHLRERACSHFFFLFVDRRRSREARRALSVRLAVQEQDAHLRRILGSVFGQEQPRLAARAVGLTQHALEVCLGVSKRVPEELGGTRVRVTFRIADPKAVLLRLCPQVFLESRSVGPAQVSSRGSALARSMSSWATGSTGAAGCVVFSGRLCSGADARGAGAGSVRPPDRSGDSRELG